MKKELQKLVDEWLVRKEIYEHASDTAKIDHHKSRFSAKAQATRDCMKELNSLLKAL